MNIPVFHDDQHGTAIVVGAAATNALRVVGKRFEDLKQADDDAILAAEAFSFGLAGQYFAAKRAAIAEQIEERYGEPEPDAANSCSLEPGMGHGPH